MFDRHYLDWNFKKITKIINYFSHSAFVGKTILDLGSSHSDVSGALSRIGGNIISIEARKNHVDIAKKKYPHINIICADLDKTWPVGEQVFDFVLNLGLICHLTNYRQVLQQSCATARTLILESEVCDSNDPNRVVRIDENKNIYDAAFNGVGNKPSAAHIEKILKECGMKFKMLDDPALNSGIFKYDWKVMDTHSRKIGNRRFWIATKDTTVNVKPISYSPKIQGINTLPLVNPSEIYSSKSIQNYIRTDGPRTAICISGYMRSFEESFNNHLMKFLKNPQIDVFIHTWELEKIY